MVIEGMAMLPKFLHLSSTAGTTTLPPLSLYASFLIPTMWYFSWWKSFGSGCDCGIPHVDGDFHILGVDFALFLDKKNMSSQQQPLEHCLKK